MMLLALAAPYLAWLELWFVFYPIALVLLFAGVVSLPTDRPNLDRDGDGVPLLSLLCNVLLFAVVVRHFNVSIEAGWGVKVIATLAAFYVLFGIVWSFDKWRRFVGHAKADVSDKITDYCDRNNIAWHDIRDGRCDERVFFAFYEWLLHESRIRRYLTIPGKKSRTEGEGANKTSVWYVDFKWNVLREAIVPRVTEHKSQVMMWLVCWPMSVIKWLFADMVTDIANAIFNSLRRQFQGVADRSFSEL